MCHVTTDAVVFRAGLIVPFNLYSVIPISCFVRYTPDPAVVGGKFWKGGDGNVAKDKERPIYKVLVKM